MSKIMPNRREAVLMAILLHGEKFGREIRDKYEERMKQAMPLGSLYTTLDRMEEHGFIKSRQGESNPERGGNRRRYFKITASGIDALNDLQAALGPAKGVPENA